MRSLMEMRERLMDPVKPQNESVFFACCAADVVVVRVVGRGTHLNSPALQEITERFFHDNGATQFVIDLGECPGMDSTFMGMLAGIAIRQRNAHTGSTVLVNVNEQNHRLLEVLGLSRLLEIRDAHPHGEPDKLEFLEGRRPELSKLERTLHMIEAHEQLLNLDTENEVKFQGVLDFLKESLEREKMRLADKENQNEKK